MKRRETKIEFGFLALLVLFAGGCSYATGRSQVTGIYQLGNGSHRIDLEMRPDQTFSEHILFSTAKSYDLVGTWRCKDGRVNFDSLWIPEEFAPEDILKVDRLAPAGHTKYTDRGFWSMSVERFLGTTSLVIFADDGIKFDMKSHPQ